MINKKVTEMLNEQINKELYSAYLYVEMNNYFEGRGLKGFAHWYKVQAEEECDHAKRIYEYLHDEGVNVKLKAIESPHTEFACDMEVLQRALEHEKYITRSIHEVYDAAWEAHDHRTMQFLDWFVAEQAEEERNANDMIDNLRLADNCSAALLMLDREYAKR